MSGPYIGDNDRAHHYDRDRILGGTGRLGLLGVSVSAEYGGAGMDCITLEIASEELEYVDTSLRVITSVHAGLNCMTLLAWGTDDQKRRYGKNVIRFFPSLMLTMRQATVALRIFDEVMTEVAESRR